jgi:hypothetical protein
MNCPECEAALQRRLDGEPMPADAALDRHLTACPACRERHTAARRLLDALKASPAPAPPAGLAGRVVAAAVRDRQRRRRRLRRNLYVTAALAASILIMLLVGYFREPPAPPKDRANEVAPRVVQEGPPAKELPPPAPEVKPEEKKDVPKAKETGSSLAALTGRLADKTLSPAKALWAAANPAEGVPMGELPAVPPLDPAAQPLRQTTQEVGEGLQVVTQSARRAFDYFARELPMLEFPR